MQLLSFDSTSYGYIVALLMPYPSCAICVHRVPSCIDTVLTRALCRIKILPVTHVLVDTWMLTVKLDYELSDVPDDLKWATNTHMTLFILTFKA